MMQLHVRGIILVSGEERLQGAGRTSRKPGREGATHAVQTQDWGLALACCQ